MAGYLTIGIVGLIYIVNFAVLIMILLRKLKPHYFKLKKKCSKAMKKEKSKEFIDGKRSNLSVVEERSESSESSWSSEESKVSLHLL